MISKVRNRANEVITWLGGSCCVPMAWRRSPKTTTIRTKQVVIKRTAGARLSTVRRSITWSVELSPSGLVHCSGPPLSPSGTSMERGRLVRS